MIKRIRNRLWLELRPMSKRSILSTLWGHRDLRKLYRESSHERFIELALDDYVGASYFEDLGKLSTYCYFKLQAQHDEDHGPLLKMQDRIRRVARELLDSRTIDQGTYKTADAVTLSNYATLLGLADEFDEAFNAVNALYDRELTNHVPMIVLGHIFRGKQREGTDDKAPLLIERMSQYGVDSGNSELIALSTKLALHSALGGDAPNPPLHKPLLAPWVFHHFTQTHKSEGSIFDRLIPRTQKLIREMQQAPAREVAQGRMNSALRVLVVTDNWNFIRKGVEALEDDGCSIRTLEFDIIKSAFHEAARNHHEAGRINQHIYSCNHEPFTPGNVLGTLEEICPLAHDLFNWCDVVICEWWTDWGVWLTRFLPPEATLVMRCHSVEVFTDMIHLSNMKRIDGLIFIAPHIKNIFESVVGERLLPPAGSSVIPNFRTLPSLEFSDRSEATQFTLGMTQYASSNKDPMFALQILEILRAKDTRWRIRFLGHPWPSGSMPVEEADCRDRFLARVDELGDAVVLDEYTHDINAWYAEIGFILSCSHREGSHESLLEGMLTGAVPVLREWPMVKPFGAPQCVYPDLPTFVDVESGADCIEAANQDFAERSQSARNYALNMVEGDDSTQRFVEYVRQCHETRFMDTARATAD